MTSGFLVTSDTEAYEDDDASDVATEGSCDVGCCSEGRERTANDGVRVGIPEDGSIKDGQTNDHRRSCASSKTEMIRPMFG